ncbi:MAG: sigma-70 family RNA polymerase sigma factor [Phycisphaerales bacterium]|nr:sigma-70 family RNA polymerase sigma factor [Phycisphaerales bacterium]
MATQERCALVANLFETYFDRLYRFARKSVDPAAAEEIAQDVFLKLLIHRDLESKTITVSYLIKIADNMLKRRHRKAARSRDILSGLARRQQAAGLGAMTAQDSQHTQMPEIRAAFDRLPRQEREAVRMIVCEGLSYDDAARSLGVQVSTVNNWKYRGIQRLKDDPAVRSHTGAPADARPGRDSLSIGHSPSGHTRRGRPRKVQSAAGALASNAA